MLGVDEHNPIMMNVAAMLLWVLLIVLVMWEGICYWISTGRLILPVEIIGYSGYAVVFFGNQIRMGMKRK